MLATWGHGSMGSAHPDTIHAARMKALLASGFVEWRPMPHGIKRLYITRTGTQWLVDHDHMPDPGQQWLMMHAVHACLVKIVALSGGWRLYPTPSLPHPWRYVAALAESSHNEDYKRLGLGGFFARAIAACDAIASGEMLRAWMEAVALREALDRIMAEPITKHQRDSYRYACESGIMDIERERLPEPVQATGT